MTREQRENFTRRVHDVHHSMGGRASAGDVAAHILAAASDDERHGWEVKGCEAEVRSSLRARNPDTGLPLAPHVDGVYVQAELLTVDEYRVLVAKHYDAARAESRRVTQYQEACHATHGVWLDAADCYAQYREAS